MTVRLAVAGQPVFDEGIAARYLAGEDGHDDRSRVAVAFADALMTRPADMSPELVAALRQQFTDAELVELMLKILKFNLQKVSVTCGHDIEMTSELIAGQAWATDFVAVPGR